MNPNEFPELRSFFNEKEQIIAMPVKRKNCFWRSTIFPIK